MDAVKVSLFAVIAAAIGGLVLYLQGRREKRKRSKIPK